MIRINTGSRKELVGIKRRSFSLTEMYHQIIEEIFDFKNVDKYKLSPTSEGWKFQAEINGNNVVVWIYVEEAEIGDFEVFPKGSNQFDNDTDVYNFGFEIGEEKIPTQYMKTTYKDYIKVLATVGDALLKFIKEKDPEIITFFSQSKHGGTGVDIQKDDIYFKALDRNKPLGYELNTIRHIPTNRMGLMLYKKDK